MSFKKLAGLLFAGFVLVPSTTNPYGYTLCTGAPLPPQGSSVPTTSPNFGYCDPPALVMVAPSGFDVQLKPNPAP
jgi:hypothetical protein